MISCCGILLPPLVSEMADDSHPLHTELIEDEIYVSTRHPMTKNHYISFLAAVSDAGMQIVKLYPEGVAETRYKRSCVKELYAYCNRHGLFRLALTGMGSCKMGKWHMSSLQQTVF